MGEVVRETLLNATGPPQVLTWEVVDPSQFPNGPSDLEKVIIDEHAWVVVSSTLLSWDFLLKMTQTRR